MTETPERGKTSKLVENLPKGLAVIGGIAGAGFGYALAPESATWGVVGSATVCGVALAYTGYLIGSCERAFKRGARFFPGAA